MKLAIQDLSSSGATPMDRARIASAIEVQLFRDYADLWQAAGVPVIVISRGDIVPSDYCPLVIFDDADQAGALGYHYLTPEGQPYGRIFWGPIRDNGGTILQGATSLSVTLSHEALEMVGDPYCNWWSDGPDGIEYALELCDPVENDVYEIDGVSVSNFVGPRYFRDGPGPYDRMGTLDAPFGMTPGGYLIERTSGADIRQVFGRAYPEWKKAGKAHAAARSARRLAKARRAA